MQARLSKGLPLKIPNRNLFFSEGMNCSHTLTSPIQSTCPARTSVPARTKQNLIKKQQTSGGDLGSPPDQRNHENNGSCINIEKPQVLSRQFRNISESANPHWIFNFLQYMYAKNRHLLFLTDRLLAKYSAKL